MQTLNLNVASVCTDPDDSGILRTRVNLEHVSPDNWPAIARLVNAAPELLEALRAADGCLVAALNSHGQGQDYLESEICGVIRAAITKAEGR